MDRQTDEHYQMLPALLSYAIDKSCQAEYNRQCYILLGMIIHGLYMWQKLYQCVVGIPCLVFCLQVKNNLEVMS